MPKKKDFEFPMSEAEKAAIAHFIAESVQPLPSLPSPPPPPEQSGSKRRASEQVPADVPAGKKARLVSPVSDSSFHGLPIF